MNKMFYQTKSLGFEYTIKFKKEIEQDLWNVIFEGFYVEFPFLIA